MEKYRERMSYSQSCTDGDTIDSWRDTGTRYRPESKADSQ